MQTLQRGNLGAITMHQYLQVDVPFYYQPILKRQSLRRQTFWHQDIIPPQRVGIALTSVSSCPHLKLPLLSLLLSCTPHHFKLVTYHSMMPSQSPEDRPYPALIFRAVPGEHTPGTSRSKTRWCMVDTHDGLGELVQSVVSTVSLRDVLQKLSL